MRRWVETSRVSGLDPAIYGKSTDGLAGSINCICSTITMAHCTGFLCPTEYSLMPPPASDLAPRGRVSQLGNKAQNTLRPSENLHCEKEERPYEQCLGHTVNDGSGFEAINGIAGI